MTNHQTYPSITHSRLDAFRDGRYSSRTGEPLPGFHDSVRIQRDRLDALIHQPFGEVRVVRWPLAADADVLAARAARGNRLPDQCCDCRVPLVEALGDQPRVAVEPERQLREVVRADRETVKVVEKAVRQDCV